MARTLAGGNMCIRVFRMLWQVHGVSWLAATSGQKLKENERKTWRTFYGSEKLVLHSDSANKL